MQGRSEYILKSVLLHSEEKYELVSIFDSCIFSETLKNNYTTGQLRLRDEYDVITRAKLIGGEKIDIIFETAETITRTFIITDIDVNAIENDHKVITLALASPAMIDFKTHISTAKKGEISKIVQSLMKDKGYEVQADETLWSMNFVFPNWSLGDCIDFLERRAVSTNNNTGYRLFESDTKWYFKSMCDMYNEEPIVDLAPVSETGAEAYNNLPYYYMNLAIDGIIEYNDFISRGSHGSTLTVVDPFNKSVIINKKESHLDNSLHDNINIFKYQHDQKHAGTTAKTVDFVQSRIITDGCFEMFKLSIDVVGIKGLEVGKTINLYVPSEARDELGVKVKNETLTSKYLITEVHHKLGRNYNKTLVLQKRLQYD